MTGRQAFYLATAPLATLEDDLVALRNFNAVDSGYITELERRIQSEVFPTHTLAAHRLHHDSLYGI